MKHLRRDQGADGQNDAQPRRPEIIDGDQRELRAYEL
jgi:hypothetical protein